MAQYWTHGDGVIKVWTHMQDPATDAPIGSTNDWSQTWDSHPDEAEELLLNWIKEQGIPNDIGYQDITHILIDLRAGEFEQV